MTKKCGQCKKTLNVSMYWKNNTTSSGFQSYCKLCHNKRKKIWIKANPDTYKKHGRRKKSVQTLKNARNRLRKERKEMTDSYICDLLIVKAKKLNREDITQDMIDFCRMNLQIKRLLKLTPKLKNSE